MVNEFINDVMVLSGRNVIDYDLLVGCYEMAIDSWNFTGDSKYLYIANDIDEMI